MEVKLKNLTLGRFRKPQAPAKVKARPAAMARRRWRVEIINENTLERTWSMRLPLTRALIVGGALVAAAVSLIIVLVVFTPVGTFFTGRLPGQMRDDYMRLAMRLDSVADVARINDAYASNIVAILTDSVSAPDIAETQAEAIPVDSLLPASEAEKRFVKQFEAREQFNLSVLSPIAAEGMIFEPPTASANGVGPVAAVYRGTVIAAGTDEHGRGSVMVQHPNDFISVYAPLSEVYVEKGRNVQSGQRLGLSTTEAPLLFELWHSGTPLDPSLYINYIDN